MSVKISIIGAGSAVFSVNLIKDICLSKHLKNCTVNLMDIDPGKLDAAYLLCRRYAGEVGAHLNLEKTLDRKKSLQGADFVINTALAAGHHRLREGWVPAKKLGYRFGGSHHVMHDESFWINFYQFRLMESVLEDMLKIAPKAWYILVANPVLAGVTYLGRKYPRAKIVGMCHGFGGVLRIADTLGLERKHVKFEVSGLNHFIWLTKFSYKGRDAFPVLDKWIKEKSKEYFKTCNPCSEMGPKPCDLYKKFGVFPIGDTANPGGGAWPRWYHETPGIEKKWRENPAKWWEGHFKNCDEAPKNVKRIVTDKTLLLTEIFPPVFSGEPMIPFIDAIADNARREIVVNILNSKKYIENIPADFEVEVPVIVDSGGVHKKEITRLPGPVMSYLYRDRIAPVEIEIAAFKEHSRELLKQLVMMDPWTTSGKQADKLIDAIFSLPYHRDMKKYYK